MIIRCILHAINNKKCPFSFFSSNVTYIQKSGRWTVFLRSVHFTMLSVTLDSQYWPCVVTNCSPLRLLLLTAENSWRLDRDNLILSSIRRLHNYDYNASTTPVIRTVVSDCNSLSIFWVTAQNLASTIVLTEKLTYCTGDLWTGLRPVAVIRWRGSRGRQVKPTTVSGRTPG